MSPGDAPLVLRTTTLITNSWFDAIAPYGESTVGVYSRIDRRPVAGQNNGHFTGVQPLPCHRPHVLLRHRPPSRRTA